MTTQTEALKRALGKIKSARDCHPNAVDTLLFEAEEILEGAMAEQPAPVQQEPIGKVIASVRHLRSISVELLPEVDVPSVDSMIYTSPQPAQRKPLTEEEMADFLGCRYHTMSQSDLEFFRLGEAAHGIKGDA